LLKKAIAFIGEEPQAACSISFKNDKYTLWKKNIQKTNIQNSTYHLLTNSILGGKPVERASDQTVKIQE